MNNNSRIFIGRRSTRNRHGEDGRSGTHTLRFTFQNGDNLPPIQTRFNDMADTIRRSITHYFGGDVVDHPYLLTFIPADDGAGGELQRTVRRITGITGEFLLETYENILKSQETITLDGFMINVQVIGSRMTDRRFTGAARPPGHGEIPKRLATYGLAEHSGMTKFKNENGGNRPDAPCGILAALLSFDEEFYIDNIEKWVIFFILVIFFLIFLI